MATIPQGNFGNSVASAGPGLQAPAPSQIGEAVSRVAQQQFAMNVDDATKRQRAAANLALAKIDNDLNDAHDEVSREVLVGNIEPGKAVGEFDKRRQKITSANMTGWSADQQAEMGGHITKLTGRLNNSLTGVIEKRNQQDTAGTMDQYAEQQLRKVMTEGPAGPVGRYAAMVEFTGGAAGWNPQQQAAKVQQFKEVATFSFFDAAGTAALEKDDLEGLRTVRAQVTGAEGEVLDPMKRAEMTRRLLGYEHQVITNQHRKAAEGRYDIASRTRDVQQMAQAGAEIPSGVPPTPQDYVALHGPSGAAMWQQEVGNYLDLAGVIGQMKVAGPAERQRMLEEGAPQPGEGYAGTAHMQALKARANEIVEKQIVADPAAYALKNSPRVMRAAQVMAQVLSDPKMPAEDKVAATDFYARTSIAEQERLGVSVIRDENAGNKPRGPKLLSNGEANHIADLFNNPLTGGAQSAQLVQSLEAQWGKYWPNVYSQLAGDNKLPPAVLVIPNMQNDGSRSRLAQASSMKPEELKALLAPSDPKDIREKLLDNFNTAQSTFVAQGADGNKTLNLVLNEAEKLAQLYRSQGKSVGDSARQAYTEVMGWKYDFADTYRVPKTEDIKAVRTGTAVTLKDIKAEDVQVFQGGAPMLLTEDALRNRTMWITTDEETGLRLMLRGSDGGVYAVHRATGGVIEFSWDTLRKQAERTKAPDYGREQDIEELRRRQQELNPRR